MQAKATREAGLVDKYQEHKATILKKHTDFILLHYQMTSVLAAIEAFDEQHGSPGTKAADCV